jgi:multidrug efflux pump subunit AcrA (membrane-fusion protein)
MPARLKLDSDPSRVITGFVQSVATAGEQDSSTRLTTFPIVIAVTAVADASWINVPAQAEIVVTVHENVVVIPERCLRAEAGGRPSVLVQQGDQRVSRSVEVGAVDRGQTHIKTGLEPGQTLVCR